MGTEADIQKLRDFFAMVYALDGPSELLRLYDSFFFQVHRAYPVHDFADTSPDGKLKGDSGAKAATASN